MVLLLLHPLAPTTTGNALSDFVTGQVSTMEQDTPYHSLISNWDLTGFLQEQLSCLAKRHAKPWTALGPTDIPSGIADLAATFVLEFSRYEGSSAPLGQLFPVMRVSRVFSPRTDTITFLSRVGIAWDPWEMARRQFAPPQASSTVALVGNEWNSQQTLTLLPFVRLSTLLLRDQRLWQSSFLPPVIPFPYIFYNPATPAICPLLA